MRIELGKRTQSINREPVLIDVVPRFAGREGRGAYKGRAVPAAHI
jgi:hypothetical protein